ncbi:MAG TPA: hypothetical protein VII95_20265 [Terriglobales bacterium]|jgi:hypothetical protein
MKPAIVILTLFMSFPVLAVQPVQPICFYVNEVCYQEQTFNNITVGIAVHDNGAYSQMDVTVANRSDAPLDVIPGPDYFTLTETAPKQQALKYKTEHDLTSSVNHRVFWTSVIAGVGAALATDTSTIRTQTPSGSTYTTTITTPDYAAQARFSDLANQAQSLGQAKISEIQRQYLHRTTLLPNDSLDGMLFFSRARKATRTEATVTIAGNQFSFVFPPGGNAPPPFVASLNTLTPLSSASVPSQSTVRTVTTAGFVATAPVSPKEWATTKPRKSQTPAASSTTRCFMLSTSRLPLCVSMSAVDGTVVSPLPPSQ